MKDVDRKVIGDLLADPDTTATALLVIVLRAYGEDVFGDAEKGIDPMDPVELWIRLQDDFHTTPHENNENRLNSLMVALSSDAFYEDKTVFMAVCSSLDDGDLGDIIEGGMEDITVCEMLWAIYEVELNRGDSVNFSPGIVAYMDNAMNTEADEQFEDTENPMSSWEQYLANKREQMFQELIMVGVDKTMIQHLRQEDLTPAHDEQGNYEPET